METVVIVMGSCSPCAVRQIYSLYPKSQDSKVSSLLPSRCFGTGTSLLRFPTGELEVARNPTQACSISPSICGTIEDGEKPEQSQMGASNGGSVPRRSPDWWRPIPHVLRFVIISSLCLRGLESQAFCWSSSSGVWRGWTSNRRAPA